MLPILLCELEHQSGSRSVELSSRFSSSFLSALSILGCSTALLKGGADCSNLVHHRVVGFNLTMRGIFSQVMNIFWSNQSLFSSQSRTSKDHKTLARIKRISCIAILHFISHHHTHAASCTYFLPRQSRVPIENGFTAALLSCTKRSSPSQRSGVKRSGSAKLSTEVYIIK